MVSQRCWFLFQHYFCKFEILISFLGKFGQKKSKLSVLTKNWHTWYLGIADSESRFRFLKFWPKIHFWENLGWKSQSCPFSLKIGIHGILMMLILIPTLVFWISDPNLDQKSQSCPVRLKIGTQTVSAMLIFVPALLFSVSHPKSFFGQIWIEKFKLVLFDKKLAHMV